MNPFKAVGDVIFEGVEWFNTKLKIWEMNSPVTTYSETGSPYIQAKIAITPWENHEYIDQLIRMRQGIISHSQGQAMNCSSARYYDELTKRLAEDYAALREEYYQQWEKANPRGFARYMRQQEKRIRQEDREQIEGKAQAAEFQRTKAEQTRADWEAAKQQTPASPS